MKDRPGDLKTTPGTATRPPNKNAQILVVVYPYKSAKEYQLFLRKAFTNLHPLLPRYILGENWMAQDAPDSTGFRAQPGCLRFRGQARAIDIGQLIHDQDGRVRMRTCREAWEGVPQGSEGCFRLFQGNCSEFADDLAFNIIMFPSCSIYWIPLWDVRDQIRRAQTNTCFCFVLVCLQHKG